MGKTRRKMRKLVLVPAYNDLAPFTAGVLWEKAAAEYVKIDIVDFRQLVREGRIPARVHPGRTRWMFLKEDLDAYLRSLPPLDASGGKMHGGEVPSKPRLKEVSIG
jgi:hypothetical protein